jgi:hypothetical protein
LFAAHRGEIRSKINLGEKIMLKKNLAAILVLFSVVFIFNQSARAQEIEAASESNLTGIQLPTGGHRLLPRSVPEEVTQTFDKIIAAGEGKFRKGDSEVLLWGGDGFRKADGAGIVSRLTSTLKSSGWRYTVEGNEGESTLFTAVKEGASRRVLFGFHGATDSGLVFSWMEVLPAQGSSQADRAENNSQPAPDPVRQNNQSRNSTGNSIVGAWFDGYASMLSGYTPTYGPKSYTPGRSSAFKYVFHPNGTFEHTSLVQSTLYNCTTAWFNDKRGRYTISGDQITLAPTKNFWRQHNSCSAAGNKEINHKLDPETYTFSVRRDEYGSEQVCFKVGNGDACYKREEK